MAFEFGTCCLSGYFLLSVTAPVAPQTGSVGGVRARGRSCDPSHRRRHGHFLLRPASAPPFVRPRPFPWFSPGRGSRDLRGLGGQCAYVVGEAEPVPMRTKLKAHPFVAYLTDWGRAYTLGLLEGPELVLRLRAGATATYFRATWPWWWPLFAS